MNECSLDQVQLFKRNKLQNGNVVRMQISKDEKYIVVSHINSIIWIHNIQTDFEVYLQVKEMIYCFAFSEQYILMAGRGNQILMYSCQSDYDFNLAPQILLKKSISSTRCMLLTSDTLITAGDNCSITFWKKSEEWDSVDILKHDSAIFSIALSYNDRILISMEYEGMALIWNIKQMQIIGRVMAQQIGANQISQIGNNGLYFTSSIGQDVKCFNIYNIRQNRMVRKYDEKTKGIFYLSNQILTIIQESLITQLDVGTSQILHTRNKNGTTNIEMSKHILVELDYQCISISKIIN